VQAHQKEQTAECVTTLALACHAIAVAVWMQKDDRYTVLSTLHHAYQPGLIVCEPPADKLAELYRMSADLDDHVKATRDVLNFPATTDLWCAGCVLREPKAYPFRRCARCGIARYCSRECQVWHHQAHKSMCVPRTPPSPSHPD